MQQVVGDRPETVATGGLLERAGSKRCGPMIREAVIECGESRQGGRPVTPESDIRAEYWRTGLKTLGRASETDVPPAIPARPQLQKMDSRTFTAIRV